MATRKNAKTDKMSGKLGPKIMYNWKGRYCERTYVIPKDPMTPAQMAHRLVFGTMSRLGAALKDVLKIGFRNTAIEGKTTEKNVFIRTNKQYISVDDGEVRIDYANLKVADGPLETVEFGEPTTDADHFDYVILAAYLSGKRNCMLSEPVFRSAGMTEITLPESWAGFEAHLYGFCWDGKDKASPSCYVGTLNNAQ